MNVDTGQFAAIRDRLTDLESAAITKAATRAVVEKKLAVDSDEAVRRAASLAGNGVFASRARR